MKQYVKSTFRPRSLSGLILLGFVAVALPLLFGTINAAIEMRNLSSASERLVTNGVAATQFTQAIVRQVASLERTARLYQILRRPSLLSTFPSRRSVPAGRARAAPSTSALRTMGTRAETRDLPSGAPASRRSA